MKSIPTRPQTVHQAEASTLASKDDRTLLRLLLDRSAQNTDVEKVADELIDRFGGLGDIAAAEIVELVRIEGLGAAAILNLKLRLIHAAVPGS